MAYPYNSGDQDAIDNLASYYNGNDYDASTNPGGMADGGHRTNFEPALNDVATVAEAISDAADYADTKAMAANSSATAAASSASSASTSASTATTQASAASASAAAAAASAASLLKFQFNTATSGDPGSGKVRFDNATFLSATKVAFNETDGNSNNIANLLAAIDDGSGTNKFLCVLTKSGGGAYFSFYATSTLTDQGSYDEFNITPIATGGSISNGDTFQATFVPMEKGDTGATGSAGADGANVGNKYTFNSATSGDPGSGKFLVNNGTLASATQLNISETDGDSAGLSALLAAIDNGTSTNKVFVLFKNAAGTKGIAGFVTAALTDAGSYDTFPWTPVTSWGSPANNDVMFMTFSIVGDKGDTGATGSAGSNGSNGTDGANAGNKFTFNSATSGDPGSGKFLVDNGTLASATQLNISETDGDSAGLSALLAAIDNGTSTNKALLVFKNAAGTKGIIGYVTAALTDAGSYNTYPWTPVTSWGSPANNDVMYLSITVVGDKGDTGATGSTGSTGAIGSAGGAITIPYVFSTTTTDSDPGNGGLRLNNATQNSATAIRLDLLDSNGATWTTVIDALDDSTTTNKGQFRLFAAADPTKFLEGDVTAVDSSTGYRNVTVSVTASSASNPFSNSDAVMFCFTRTGDKGSDGVGAGDVVGPGSATDNALARFDTTTGKLLQNSTVGLGDSGPLAPITTDTVALGSTTLMWSDLFLADGAVINFNNGNYTVTHSSALLTFSGAINVGGKVAPTSDDGAALGDGTHGFSDLFLASGAVLNIANSNWVATHTSGILTVGTGDLRVSTAGTNSASVVTVGGTQTLTSKTLTSANVTTKLAPTTDDGAPLGDTTHHFSDLFLATGAVINYQNGNFTITHSSGLLTMSGPLSLGTGNALTAGSIELGHASDTTISRVSAGKIAVEGVNVVTTSSTDTLTNKTLIASSNVTEESSTTTSDAAPAPTGGSLRNFFSVTALATNPTFAAPSGSPSNGNRLLIRIKDNGTGRTVAWNAIYRAIGATLPTSTTANKTVYVGFIYNSADSKWDCIGVQTEA